MLTARLPGEEQWDFYFARLNTWSTPEATVEAMLINDATFVISVPIAFRCLSISATSLKVPE
jgi:hypothetical protein